MTNSAPKCIECGGPVDSLNEDEDGEPCPACAERLLESLPGVFHSPWTSGSSSGEPEPESDSAGSVDEDERSEKS